MPSMPPWVQEGGYNAWAERLQDPTIRERVKREMTYADQRLGELLSRRRFAGQNPARRLQERRSSNRSLAKRSPKLRSCAAPRPKTPRWILVIEDGSRVGTVYFLMSEENVKKQIKLPWVSFDSDAASLAPEGVFLKSNPHPRAYGNFARLLGKYVRDEKVIPLEEAVRRLTSFPCDNSQASSSRGRLQNGHFADVVVFDPARIQDHATFDKPHQYSTGVAHVFVNGVQVLSDGEHTGAKPGRVVRGPGWKGH